MKTNPALNICVCWVISCRGSGPDVDSVCGTNV